jgi:hypothetical protein
MTGPVVSSVRPVWSISQNKIWTSPLDMSRRVDQDSFVERQNRSPDEGDMSYTNLHAKSTGAPDRSGRCSPIPS